MKVLLYGGTFDPPHNGHLNNLQAAAERVRPDQVVVMPAGVPPHKAASSTPAALRLEMCRCFYALEGTPYLPRIMVSDWEIRQRGLVTVGAVALGQFDGHFFHVQGVTVALVPQALAGHIFCFLQIHRAAFLS